MAIKSVGYETFPLFQTPIKVCQCCGLPNSLAMAGQHTYLNDLIT